MPLRLIKLSFGDVLGNRKHHHFIGGGMTEFIYDSWNGIMNHNKNPLKHIPDLQIQDIWFYRYLAWMWCIVFSMYVGSIFVMGITMIAHVIFLLLL